MSASPGRNNNNGSSPPKSSSSSSTCSSHARCSPLSAANRSLLAKESMEEVWKDITLPSVDDDSAGTDISKTTKEPTFPSMILQDFLATPLNKEAPRRSGISNVTSLAEETTFFRSLAPSPGTILSLNSGSDFQYIESGDVARRNRAVNSRTGGSETFPSCCKKRAQENNGNSNDRRYKRMMKNRESAARSRARKQAYTYELEFEVTRLLKENAKLRRQQDKFLAAPAQPPEKNTLNRTLTAPF